MISAPPRPLWVIDFDRTLVDGDLPDAIFVDICGASGVKKETALQAKADVEERGGSFDSIDYLQSIGMPQKKIDELCEAFVRAAHQQNDLLLPGAMQLIEALDAAGSAYVVLTYGGIQWQLAKLRAASLFDRPFIVTSQKEKGKLIAGWKKNSGYMVLADHGQELAADHIRLIDDKASSFSGLPADCFGYLIRWPERPILKSQQGEVPANVATITSFDGVLGELIPDESI